MPWPAGSIPVRKEAHAVAEWGWIVEARPPDAPSRAIRAKVGVAPASISGCRMPHSAASIPKTRTLPLALLAILLSCLGSCSARANGCRTKSTERVEGRGHSAIGLLGQEVGDEQSRPDARVARR